MRNIFRTQQRLQCQRLVSVQASGKFCRFAELSGDYLDSKLTTHHNELHTLSCVNNNHSPLTVSTKFTYQNATTNNKHTETIRTFYRSTLHIRAFPRQAADWRRHLLHCSTTAADKTEPTALIRCSLQSTAEVIRSVLSPNKTMTPVISH